MSQSAAKYTTTALEGAVNVRGQLVPVIDLRARLSLAAKALDPDEFLVFLEAGTRTLAFRVDEIDDIVDLESDAVAGSATLSPALRGLAGLAGYLWGAQTGFINPELMGFQMSAHAIMMVILGGMGNFAGAIFGAFAFEYVLHVLKDLPTVGSVNLGKHWQLWMGLFIVLLVVFAPRGLLGLVERFTRRKEAPHE